MKKRGSKCFFFVFWYLISSKHPFLDQSFTVKYWAMPRPPLGTDLLSQDPVVLVNVTTWSCMTMTSFIKASLITIEYLQRPGVRYQPGSVHGLLVELGVVPEVEAVKHSQTGHDPQHSLRWGLICCRKNEMTMVIYSLICLCIIWHMYVRVLRHLIWYTIFSMIYQIFWCTCWKRPRFILM